MRSSTDKVSIPFWIYLIVGGVMILVSYLVDMQTKDNTLVFFIFAGAIFLMVGVGKLIYVKMVAKPAAKTSHPAHHANDQQAAHMARHSVHRIHRTHPQAHAVQGASQVRMHSPPRQHHAEQAHVPEIRCRRCHAKLHPRFRYCPGCGAKAR